MACDNRVKMNGDAFNNDLSGSRSVYLAGLRAELSPTLTAHISAGYLQGKRVASPWSATAGVNWRF